MDTDTILFASAAASAEFALSCLEPAGDYLRACSSFVTPEREIMHWHDFGDLEGPGWAANAVGGAHLLWRWGDYLGDSAVQAQALALLDHILEDGFIDDRTGFIRPYYELAQDRFCLNYVHGDDWLCPGSLARIGSQLLEFAGDLGAGPRVPRTVEVARRLGEWLHGHVAPLPNGWVPRRIAPDGLPYASTPDGRPDPIFDHSADGLFLLDLYCRLTAAGLAPYRVEAQALGDAFVASGGCWGSMNHDTYDDQENVAYAVAFRVLRPAAVVCDRPAWHEFAYQVALPGLAPFQMQENRHGVATAGLLWMEETWNTAYLWENAEGALAFLEAWAETGEVAHRETALRILTAIARHHYGDEGFLSEGIDWDNHVTCRHHVREALYGAIRYTEPLLNNLHVLAPTLYYFMQTGYRRPLELDPRPVAERAKEFAAQAGPRLAGQNGARYLLRLYHPALATDERVEGALRFAQAAGADAVLLFEASFDMDPALLTLPVLRQRFARLGEVARRFRAAGLEVQLNVMITMGHVDAGSARPERFPFQFQVDEHGNLSRSTACPLDPAFLTYVKEMYTLAAGCGASVIWVDDDVRYVLHDVPGMTCFCPRHLAAMAERSGRPWTREQLVAALRAEPEPGLPPDPDCGPALRATWFDLQQDSMLGLAHTVEAAVHAVSPSARIGLMTIGTTFHAAEGRRTDALLRAYAGPTRPLIRPGSGYYHDWTPGAGFEKAEDGARQMSVVNEDVQGVAEIETYPYTPFAKSERLLGLELALDALAGMPDLSLNLLTTMGGSGPLEPEGSDYAPWLRRLRPFLDALARARAGRIRRGIGIADSEDWARYAPLRDKPLTAWIGQRPWEGTLLRLGLPIGRPDSGPHWIAGDVARSLPDGELAWYLGEGAVLDPLAAEALLDRGWGPRLGLAGVRPVRSGANERLTGDPLNGSRAGQCFPAYNMLSEGLYTFDTDPGATRVLSRWMDVDGEDCGPATVALTPAGGPRAGLLPFALSAPAFVLLNVAHREQWAALLGWVAGRPLPCRIVRGVNLYPLAFEAANGQDWLVVVANLGADDAPDAELEVRPPAGRVRSVERLDPGGAWQRAAAPVEHTLAVSVPAFGVSAYLCRLDPAALRRR